jgi:hypothetical protein
MKFFVPAAGNAAMAEDALDGPTDNLLERIKNSLLAK